MTASSRLETWPALDLDAWSEALRHTTHVDVEFLQTQQAARSETDYPALPLLLSLVDKAIDRNQPMVHIGLSINYGRCGGHSNTWSSPCSSTSCADSLLTIM